MNIDIWYDACIDNMPKYELDLITYEKHLAIIPVKLKTGGFACCRSVYFCKVWGGDNNQTWGRGGTPTKFIESWFMGHEELLIEKLKNPTRYVGVEELTE